MKEYLEAGLIANTHGIKGDVVIESYCNTPKAFTALKSVYRLRRNEYTELVITKAAEYKGRVLAHIEGYNTPEEAAALKGCTVYAKREQFHLAKGDHFIADIMGLDAFDEESGEKVGVISDILMHSASDIYEITCLDGHKALVPAVAEFVRKVDIEKGVYFHFIEGML